MPDRKGAALASEQLRTLILASDTRSDGYDGPRGWTVNGIPSTPGWLRRRVPAVACVLLSRSLFRRRRGAPRVRRQPACRDPPSPSCSLPPTVSQGVRCCFILLSPYFNSISFNGCTAKHDNDGLRCLSAPCCAASVRNGMKY